LCTYLYDDDVDVEVEAEAEVRGFVILDALLLLVVPSRVPPLSCFFLAMLFFRSLSSASFTFRILAASVALSFAKSC
jgi:hypothetical protein